MDEPRYGLRTPVDRASTSARERQSMRARESMRAGGGSPSLQERSQTAGRRRKVRSAALAHPMADHGGYIAGLDGLRALAVISVIIYHAFPGVLRGGFLGVDVFFVISGFLITTLLLREDRAHDVIDLKAFWVRRARRLLPALIALTIVVVPAAWLVSRDLMVGIGRQVAGALTFSTNWLEIAHGSSYFDSTTPLLFKNFWSLAIEEQFYLVWPLIMLVVLALIGSWIARVSLGLAIAIGSGLLMMVLYSGENLTRLYYGTDTHIFGIALGVTLAFVWADGEAQLLGSAHWRRFNAGYGWFALIALVIFMLIIPDDGPWAYMGGMFAASLAASIIIAAMLTPDSFFAAVGETTVLRWFGTRSYGLYLWHWPLLVIAGVLIPTAVGSLAGFGRSVAVIAVTCVIVEASYRWIETPVRRKGIRRAVSDAVTAVRITAPGKVVAAIAAALVLATVTAIILAPEKSSTQVMIEAGEVSAAGQAGGAASASEPSRSQGEASATEQNAPARVSPTLTEGFDATVPDASEVTVIGDSMVAASRTGIEYAMPGVTVIGQSNHTWRDAPEVVASALERGDVGRVVVLDYGTNAGLGDEEDVRKVIDLLGPDRMIHLVNLYSPSTFIETSNEILAVVAERYESVNLIDWHSVASGDPSMLQVDQTHTSIEGANAFGALIKDDITAFSTELSTSLGTDPGTGWGDEGQSGEATPAA